MAKNVDKIVKGVEKLIDQLGVCIDNCLTEIATHGGVISRAQAKWKIANGEIDRARRIQDKLRELIK